jgi:hypothetical protein
MAAAIASRGEPERRLENCEGVGGSGDESMERFCAGNGLADGQRERKREVKEREVERGGEGA